MMLEEIFPNEVFSRNALNKNHENEWFDPISNEMAAILDNETQELVDEAGIGEVAGGRIILQEKLDSNGVLKTRKACLFAQRPEIDV